jgi:UDP-N-acetyl-D-mannosaminuronate dehydrogenase
MLAAGRRASRGQPIRGSRFLVRGLACKENVDKARESPAAAILELLRERGPDT